MCVEQDYVLEGLASAFPWIRNNPPYDLNNHQYWLGLRRHLPRLPPADLLQLLPFVLYDLTLTHTGSWIESEDAEHVLMRLRAESEAARIENSVCHMYSAGSFGLFDKRQAKVLFDWLQLVQDWDEWEIWQEYLADALDYWRLRSE